MLSVLLLFYSFQKQLPALSFLFGSRIAYPLFFCWFLRLLILFLGLHIFHENPEQPCQLLRLFLVDTMLSALLFSSLFPPTFLLCPLPFLNTLLLYQIVGVLNSCDLN